MSMPCTKVRRLLQLYVDGELPLYERALLERHVRACALCTEELNSLVRMLSLLSMALSDEVKAPATLERQVVQTLRREQAKDAERPERLSIRGLAVRLRRAWRPLLLPEGSSGTAASEGELST